MDFDFTPSGAPISSSFSISSSLTSRTSAAGFPSTASLAGFASNNYGPQGPPYAIASGSSVKIVSI